MDWVKNLGELSISAAALSILAWVITQLVVLIKGKNGGGNGVPLQHALDIINRNTETSAKLVAAIDNQTRVIADLVQAVNRLLGKLD